MASYLKNKKIYPHAIFQQFPYNLRRLFPWKFYKKKRPEPLRLSKNFGWPLSYLFTLISLSLRTLPLRFPFQTVLISFLYGLFLFGLLSNCPYSPSIRTLPLRFPIKLSLFSFFTDSSPSVSNETVLI